jgi:hypothetical protein
VAEPVDLGGLGGGGNPKPFDLWGYLEDIGAIELNAEERVLRALERGELMVNPATPMESAQLGAVYAVADGTQVVLESELYGSGEQILCTAANAADVTVWLRHGWVIRSGSFN